jgi:predicted glutamine amidotransferase
MCIAIVNKSGTLPLETFTASFKNNPDGIGIAFTDGDEVRTIRTMDKPDQLHTRYLEIRETNPHPILIHARIGTHGSKDLGNVHPFKVNKETALIHNGIVDAPNYRPDRSDTWHLVDLLKMMHRPADLFDKTAPAHQWLKELAGYSKIALLNAQGETVIIGEDKGTWLDGTWYSNGTYKESCSYIDKGGRSYASLWEDEQYSYFGTKAKTGSTLYTSDYQKASFILGMLNESVTGLSLQATIDTATDYALSWGYKSLHALYTDAQTWKA